MKSSPAATTAGLLHSARSGVEGLTEGAAQQDAGGVGVWLIWPFAAHLLCAVVDQLACQARQRMRTWFSISDSGSAGNPSLMNSLLSGQHALAPEVVL